MDFSRIQRHFDQGDLEGIAHTLMSGFSDKYGTQHAPRGMHILGEGPFPAVGTQIRTNVNHLPGRNYRGANFTSHVPDEAGNLHELSLATWLDGPPDVADWRINEPSTEASRAFGLAGTEHPKGLWTPERRSIADFVTNYGQHPAPEDNWRRANASILREKALRNRGPSNIGITVFDNGPDRRNMSFVVDSSGRYVGPPDQGLGI